MFFSFFFLSLRELTTLHHLSNRNPLVSPPTSPLPYFIFFGERNFVPGQQLGNYKVLLFVCGSTRVEIIFLYIFFFFNMLKFQKVGGENFFDSLKWTIIFIIFVFFFVFELYRNVSRNFSAKKKKNSLRWWWWLLELLLWLCRSVGRFLLLNVWPCVCVSNILRGSSYHLTIGLAAATHNRTHIVV